MYRIAYCSNVHAGASLTETRENLETYSVQVKKRFCPGAGMGVGLWLSDRTATELLEDSAEAKAFSEFLHTERLEAFTFNGFPFGNFHQAVVKHAVYQPTWSDPNRLAYTQKLTRLIHQFAPPGEASISTLPIAWGGPPAPKREALELAGEQLRKLADYLAEFEKETGRLVHVCIEPEPGCLIQRAEDVVDFFEEYLWHSQNAETIRRHIRVCHDVCHSVVMGESQTHALSTYQRAGIQIGKVQISSAVWVDFDAVDEADRKQAFAELSAFAEDRYLHQTTIQLPGQQPKFYEDLPLALNSVTSPDKASGIWRIHFHVPVYLEKFGQLCASQQEIIEFVSSCREFSDVKHFEVETYAWNVLPRDLQQENLAAGIAQELTWFAGVAQKSLGSTNDEG